MSVTLEILANVNIFYISPQFSYAPAFLPPSSSNSDKVAEKWNVFCLHSLFWEKIYGVFFVEPVVVELVVEVVESLVVELVVEVIESVVVELVVEVVEPSVVEIGVVIILAFFVCRVDFSVVGLAVIKLAILTKENKNISFPNINFPIFKYKKNN